MICIYCRHRTDIINSRPQKRLNRTWRRRQCQNCGAVFSTIETPDLSKSIVFCSEGAQVQPFDRDKLFVSLLQALGHRNDAVAASSALTATVIAKLVQAAQDAQINRVDVVRVSYEVLAHFDAAAAIHYQAYHTIQDRGI